ncbi:DUF6194 family protein [Nocardia farcinica]|uniref:DUF6194 family protein n=1 Tax=Nocardia farcinica TaxID=37329 RepID=UPI0032AEB491
MTTSEAMTSEAMTIETMTIEAITAHIESLGGVLTLRPGPGDGSPELAWGDLFFYYAPDGDLPPGQPFATVVTKNYPDDTASRLDRPGAFRVNADIGRDGVAAHIGRDPKDDSAPAEDPAADDTVIAHPLYGRAGWVSVVNPGPRTAGVCLDLLALAHDRARARAQRRRTR